MSGLGFLLRLDQSQTIDSSSSITPILPWTTVPFTEKQKKERLMRMKELFKRDGVVESDDGLSGSARNFTLAAPDPLPDDDDVPARPKLSCPVTPCQGFAEEDALPSAACTPLFDDEATVRADKQVAEQPASWDFTAIWDWEVSGFKTSRSRLPPSRARTSAFNKPPWKGDGEPEGPYFSRKGAQTNAPTNNDHENQQREANHGPNLLAQIDPLAQNRKRRGITLTRDNQKYRRKFENAKKIRHKRL